MENQNKTSDQIGCGYCRHEKTCKDRDPKKNKAKDCINFIHHELKDLMGSHPYFKSKSNYGYKKVDKNFSHMLCKGSMKLGTGCGKCQRCVDYINTQKDNITTIHKKGNQENLNTALAFLESNDIDYNSATEKVWMEALKIAAGFE